MKLTQRAWVAIMGLAVLASAGYAQDQSTDVGLRLGQPRMYRWNELRTGYGFDPSKYDATNPDQFYLGLPSNQMPAIVNEVEDRNGRTGLIPSPDLQWFFPLDVEGGALDEPGNAYPIGNRLGAIHSSPTVASLHDVGPEPLLSVMFGATQTVRRDIRNTLPSPLNSAGRPATIYTTDGTYDANRDPYSYLQGENAGSVFALEAFDGTTEELDAGDVTRRYLPLWWYGVRSLPYYTADDNDISFGTDSNFGELTFRESPSLQQHRLYMNVSDSMVRAFDYAPSEVRDPDNGYLPPATGNTNQQTNRQRLLAQYLAPDLDDTTLSRSGDETGPGIDSGAGPVGPNRPDIPERLTDRLYNLSIDGARFGLAANKESITGSSSSSDSGKPDIGPLDNRFRLNNGMGAVQSTGVFVRLDTPVSYVSAYYDVMADATDQDVQRLQETRRDPDKVKTQSLSTRSLYIVGSDDGYVYAFDADPTNARRLGAGALTTTYAGRLVWAFRTAVRAPLYTAGTGGDRQPVTVYAAAPGENPGPVLTDSGGYVHVTEDDSSALAAPSAPIISGPVVSSPASAVVTLPDTAFNYSGQTRAVVYVGSAIGRLFCLDAATGQEIWEFKTTPRGQTMLRKSNGDFVEVDSVAGYAINTAPSLGFVPGATSQLHPGGATGRLAVFFGADDGKVYALDATDGSPLRNGMNPGWDVEGDVVTGATVPDDNMLAGPGTRGMLDHFGFVTYPFERNGAALPDATVVDGKHGRARSPWAKPLNASVVLRPSAAPGYTDPTGYIIPAVDRVFIASPTNQSDATVGNDPAFTGGSIFAVDPLTARVVWTFDRWDDVTRDNNGAFDDNPAQDEFIRPGGFNAAPAYAPNINIFNDGAAANGDDGSTENGRLENQNVLFAVDNAGRMFALRTDDDLASVNRLYWRYPYPLPGNLGSDGAVYSTPVVSTPITEGDMDRYGGHAYVFVGIATGLVAVDVVAPRADALVNEDGDVLDDDIRITGGEITWGWQTAEDVFVFSQDNVDDGSGLTSNEFEVNTVPRPVVTTPAIHAGYVWAGSDSGYLYAWRNTEDGFTFNNFGGSGRIPYFGGNRPRQPMPDINRPSGGASTTGSIPLYVDIFQAGYTYGVNGGFNSPSAVQSITPTGAPAGANDATAGPVTPQPVGLAHAEFQEPMGGVLEWGDPLSVVAWSNDPAAGLDEAGTVTFQVTGPSTSAQLKADVDINGSSAYARQIFYLNPFGSMVPLALRYPGDLAVQQGANPFYRQTLPPGNRGQSYTVTAFYQGPPLEFDGPNGQVQTRRQAMQRARVNATTKFILANPLNIAGHINGSGVQPLVTGSAQTDPNAVKNGNEVVPIVASVIGDHGVPTAPQQREGSYLQVADRSHLPQLRAMANRLAAGTGDEIYLRVRVQPARLRWMGGPTAARKPLLAQNNNLPNGLPVPNGRQPEPFFTEYWGPQRASFFGVAEYYGAEQPPFVTGEENRSVDYPDIMPGASTWIDRVYGRNASDVDAPVAPAAQFFLRAEVPRYQPANFSPANVDPARNTGVGPGYYTVNPSNGWAAQASLLGWNPGASNQGGPYGAFTSPEGNNLWYYGPLKVQVPTSPSLAAQEPNYLTKVFVDVNGNGTADIGAGEAYRMFVSGVQVRPEERLRVANMTVSVPNSPEKGIPGGYIPFQYYYDRQVDVAGGTPAEGDRFLFGERNFYSPLNVYNAGNVNLWSVRLSKYDPLGSHLLAPSVDPTLYAGADELSNWPGAGVIKRFNLNSTLDPLPIPAGSRQPGAPDDPLLWTPAAKPKPASVGDEGLGQLMLVKDVFPTDSNGAPLMNRPHASSGSVSILDSGPGRPYVTVAVPPGTTPGNYATESGRLILFEDAANPNGILDTNAQGQPVESFVTGDTVVIAEVAESRLTDKVSRFAPFLPNADKGVAMAAEFNFDGTPAGLADVWSKLAQDTTPAAYRDPRTGHLVTFWSSNRVGQVLPDGTFETFAPFAVTNQVSGKYHIFGTAMAWQDPQNPPVEAGSNPNDFISGTLSSNPWGWNYQGGNVGNFFFPNFGEARWFGEPQASPWIPNSATVNNALGLPAGTVNPLDLTYTSPAVITNFHGTQFPPVLFWTGSTGVGPNARSAIFYAPIEVNAATGQVTAGDIQAVGVTGGQRTLDPFIPKFGPRPFLITVGGSYAPTGDQLPTSYLRNEEVKGLGVVWFGGAPGAWKLYVSTIETDEQGNLVGNGQWKNTQLTLPEGLGSAMHPSVYYHQMPKVLQGGDGAYRQSILEVAFTGYSRSGRNPDIYLVRYIAAQGDEDWSPASTEIGNWDMMGFSRQGGRRNNIADKPLEQLLRVAGEPRPIYRSNWAAWQGRNNLGTVVYWFKKPVGSAGQPSRDDDYYLYATFDTRRPGRDAGVVEVSGDLAGGGRLPGVTAFIDTAAGTVRFTTSDPVSNPAPLSRPHQFDGQLVQDVIYVAMNPYAMRVTTDDNIADSMPQIWLDETHDIITRQNQTNVTVSETNPLNIRRDRMWVLWRRAAQPEGSTQASSLFYKTFRLGVDVGRTIPLDANGRPQVTVQFIGNNATPVGPFVVDAARGRVYFTSFNDGDEVLVKVANEPALEYNVGWIPEDVSAPMRYGVAVDGNRLFRLPVGQWVEPRAVPSKEQGNDSHPWMFKDPFSDLAPGTPGYYARGNNNMWLFWASTRESRTYGRLKSAPDIGLGSGQVDPYYFADGALLYSGSASDVYYTTLSPDFNDR